MQVNFLLNINLSKGNKIDLPINQKSKSCYFDYAYWNGTHCGEYSSLILPKKKFNPVFHSM